jgi:hypothetical protein
VRATALCVISNHWGITENCAKEYEQVAQQDPDGEVRQIGCLCIGSHYNKTQNVRIGKLLAEIVGEEVEDLEVRKAAYFALGQVAGLDSLALLKIVEMHFPEDVNWRFVRKFLKVNEKIYH